MTQTAITCDRFDALLSDRLEGTLDGDLLDATERHLRGCDRCAALVRDLDAIVSDAATLPRLAPSRDLWTGIGDRIGTPVVAIGSAPATRHMGQRRTILRFGAAAAALMLVTAGVTYTITRRSMESPATVAAANVASTVPGTSVTSAPAAAPVVAPGAESVTPARPDEPVTAPVANSAPRVTAVSNAAATRNLYDREIAALDRILTERREVLDPATAAILENNLTIIDRAIAESREALRRDPASRFLGDQLDRALDKKLELLRTAALLPSRT